MLEVLTDTDGRGNHLPVKGQGRRLQEGKIPKRRPDVDIRPYFAVGGGALSQGFVVHDAEQQSVR